jgi:hypothetical protein
MQSMPGQSEPQTVVVAPDAVGHCRAIFEPPHSPAQSSAQSFAGSLSQTAQLSTSAKPQT